MLTTHHHAKPCFLTMELSDAWGVHYEYMHSPGMFIPRWRAPLPQIAPQQRPCWPTQQFLGAASGDGSSSPWKVQKASVEKHGSMGLLVAMSFHDQQLSTTIGGVTTVLRWAAQSPGRSTGQFWWSQQPVVFSLTIRVMHSFAIILVNHQDEA